MKLQFKLSILIALTIIMLSISLTQAEVPITIGTTPQTVPFESNPTSAGVLGTPFISSPTATLRTSAAGLTDAQVKDSNLDAANYASITGGPAAAGTGYFDAKTFQTNGNTATITSVDYRIKYMYTAAGTLWSYGIIADQGAAAFTTLVADTGTSAALNLYKFDGKTTAPDGGGWTWAKITALRIRFKIIRAAAGTTGFPTYRITEAWIRVNIADGESATMITTAFNPPEFAYDGLIDTDAKFGGVHQPSTGSVGTLEGYNGSLGLASFTTGSAFDPPGWVDLKMRYTFPGSPTNITLYRILYSVSGAGPVVLQDWTNSSYTVSTSTLAQTWFNITNPNDAGGAWTWTDISSIDLRLETMVKGDGDIPGSTINFSEAWLSVYPAGFPPAASTTVSVWPDVIETLDVGTKFFVDIYIRNPLGPEGGAGGYNAYLSYDSAVLTAINPNTDPDFGYTYWPLTDPSPYDFGSGYVTVGGSLPTGSPFFTGGYNGTNNGFPAARIYFEVVGTGTSALTFDTTSGRTAVTDPAGNFMTITVHDGQYGVTTPEFPLGTSFIMLLAPIVLIAYLWKLRKRGVTYH
jgi:hypothetical protein